MSFSRHEQFEQEETVMAALRKSLSVEAAHPLFQGVFSDWQAKAGVRSALPDAPVVADGPRTGRPVRHRPRSGRDAGRGLRSWFRLAATTATTTAPTTPSR
ncbi:hypothetical protein [Streptomyces sp. NPDC005374]|uniref:hypothetical protein n=1 Tax=Streptomyces sp. NPDC005374 TaxID=3364713 RepID=UPI0036BD006A